MLNEKISKRPISGKPTLLRPLTSKPKISFQNMELENKKESSKLPKNIIPKNNILTKDSNYSNNTIDQTAIENSHNLDLFKKEYNKDNSILLNELKNIEDFEQKREKLKNINLIEKDYDELYDWTNLLNNSRPLSCYTTLNKKTLKIKKEDNKVDEQNKNKKIKNRTKHTIIACDNKQLNSNSNSKINNKNNDNSTLRNKRHSRARSRPMSVYTSRYNSSFSSLYSSKTMYGYHNPNLKTFSGNFTNLLKPKLKSNSYQLKHEIKKQRILSARKEKELEKKLKEQINLEKQDLIIAAEKKNPVPLLKSIFKQMYPDQEVIKENVKMYFNTMKPFNGDEDDRNVDYTKNDRWRWIQEMKKMRMKKKLKINKSDLDNYNYIYNINNFNEDRNLILSYYNQDDPYIKLFNNIINNKIQQQNNIINNNNEKNKVNENCYNPILQKLNDNFTTKKIMINENKSNIQYNQNYIEKKEEINEKKEIIKDIKNIRPKTGFKPYKSNAKNPWAKRPQTSSQTKKVKESMDTSDKNYESFSDTEYVSSNSFPLKTLSNVGNVSYEKINQRLHQRKFASLKIKSNNFNGNNDGNNKNSKSINPIKYNEDNIVIPKRKTYKKTLSFNQICDSDKIMKVKDNGKWTVNSGYNKKDINYYNFDDIMFNLFNKSKGNNKGNLYTLNYYKNIGGKFYSSSNNAKIAKKRNSNMGRKLNHLFSDSRYSKDDPECDLIGDDGLSSRTTQSFHKI